MQKRYNKQLMINAACPLLIGHTYTSQHHAVLRAKTLLLYMLIIYYIIITNVYAINQLLWFSPSCIIYNYSTDHEQINTLVLEYRESLEVQLSALVRQIGYACWLHSLGQLLASTSTTVCKSNVKIHSLRY